jgi:homoserine kinase
MKGSGWITRRLPVHESLRFTVLIPDQQVETEKARSLFPGVMERKSAAENSAKAILMTHALAAADLPLLKEAAKDQIHEPYRKQLIPHFDAVQAIAEQDQRGALVISGSGSACLYLGTAWLSEAAEALFKG